MRIREILETNDNEPPDMNTPKWVYGPAGNWSPTTYQIANAQSYASGYYEAGYENEYSIGQFIQDIEDQ
jgi:hypothetical protein